MTILNINNYKFQNQIRTNLNQIKHNLENTDFALAIQLTQALIHQFCESTLQSLSNLELQTEFKNLNQIEHYLQQAKSEMQYLTGLAQLRYVLKNMTNDKLLATQMMSNMR